MPKEHHPGVLFICRREDNNRQIGIVLFKQMQHLSSILVRQLDIKNDRRERQRFHTCQCRPASSDTVYHVSL